MNKYIKVFGAASIVCVLSILGGALNWLNQLAIVFFLYFIVGFIHNPKEFKAWQFCLLILSPFMFIYGYFSIKDNLIYVYPILFAPLISLIIAVILKKQYHVWNKRIIYSILILYLVLGLILSYVAMPNWLLYFLIAKDNIHNGNKVSGFKFQDSQGKEINESSFYGKTVVLDFWSTSCGICYKEFPDFEEMVYYYSKDTGILFYSVNIPLQRDTSRYYDTDRALKYNFNQLFTDFSERDSIVKKFNIEYFPRLVIIDKDLNLRFSGSCQYKRRELIDNAYHLINEIKNQEPVFKSPGIQ